MAEGTPARIHIVGIWLVVMSRHSQLPGGTPSVLALQAVSAEVAKTTCG
jgi:hypothetical protein